MLIVQYLSEYITAVSGDTQKIAEFEERYGYSPKPYLRDGIQDARYYKLTNFYPDESSRYTAAVRLFSVVFHEPKVAPPRGKHRELIRQWLLWLSRREEYMDIEELVDRCKRETGIGSEEMINSIIIQVTELIAWRNASKVVVDKLSHLESISAKVSVANENAESSLDASASTNAKDLELLEKFKNHQAYRSANAKDRKAMKKAFANMTHEERVSYFELD
jgi:hypothetical protein